MKLSRTCHVSFCQISPLKIRGERGVMEITPFIPLTLRGRLKELQGNGVVYETNYCYR